MIIIKTTTLTYDNTIYIYCLYNSYNYNQTCKYESTDVTVFIILLYLFKDIHYSLHILNTFENRYSNMFTEYLFISRIFCSCENNWKLCYKEG